MDIVIVPVTCDRNWLLHYAHYLLCLLFNFFAFLLVHCNCRGTFVLSGADPPSTLSLLPALSFLPLSCMCVSLGVSTNSAYPSQKQAWLPQFLWHTCNHHSSAAVFNLDSPSTHRLIVWLLSVLNHRSLCWCCVLSWDTISLKCPQLQEVMFQQCTGRFFTIFCNSFGNRAFPILDCNTVGKDAFVGAVVEGHQDVWGEVVVLQSPQEEDGESSSPGWST